MHLVGSGFGFSGGNPIMGEGVVEATLINNFP